MANQLTSTHVQFYSSWIRVQHGLSTYGAKDLDTRFQIIR
jgi:hypothetical protein